MEVIFTYTNELYHHGVKGQKWGVRRYQNEDGTRTAAGKKRYELTNYQKVNSKKHILSSSKESYNKAKLDYKSGGISKTELKNSRQAFKQAKKDYNIELKKRNENYSDKQYKLDKVLNTYKDVNRLMNKHGDMSLSKARTIAYSKMAATTTAQILFTKFIAPKLTTKLNDFTKKTLEKAGSSPINDGPAIFSNKLGRYLTEAEIEKLGL